jgi:hypothetical protein
MSIELAISVGAFISFTIALVCGVIGFRMLRKPLGK